jgi:hypothetical protein
MIGAYIMTWTQEQAFVNQHIQIGAESLTALGTSVSASKILQCYDVVFQMKGDTTFYRPVGRKYPAVQEQNTEWVEGSWSGAMDYNALQYILAGVFGSASVAAHAGPSATAKDWIYTPPVTGSIVPQTYTVEQGDSTRAHKSTYQLFNDFGYTITRKSTSITAKSIGRPMSDGITLTSTPAAVALAPVPGKHASVYLDTASGSLGGTLLTKVLQVQYAMPAVYQPFWPINAASAGFSNHVDMAPAATIKLLMEADSVGMARLADWQAGTTYFLRVDALGTVAIAADGPSSASIYNEFKHDMAVKFGEPSQYQDKDGVFAIEWTGTIVEDATWAKAQTATVTNLIAAL